MFQRTHKISIVMHGFIIARIFFTHLLHKTFSLVFSVVQLREAVCQLATTDKEFKAVSNRRVFIIATCKWRNFNWVLSNESGLIQFMFNSLFKDFDMDFTQTVRVFNFNSQIFGGFGCTFNSAQLLAGNLWIVLQYRIKY